MADADIYLGEQDTGPVLSIVCLGVDGEPFDITGATVTLQFRPENDDAAIVSLSCSIVSGIGGKISCIFPGYAPGRYSGRVKVVLPAGDRISFPNNRHLTIVVTPDP